MRINAVVIRVRGVWIKIIRVSIESNIVINVFNNHNWFFISTICNKSPHYSQYSNKSHHLRNESIKSLYWYIRAIGFFIGIIRILRVTRISTRLIKIKRVFIVIIRVSKKSNESSLGIKLIMRLKWVKIVYITFIRVCIWLIRVLFGVTLMTYKYSCVSSVSKNTLITVMATAGANDPPHCQVSCIICEVLGVTWHMTRDT